MGKSFASSLGNGRAAEAVLYLVDGLVEFEFLFCIAEQVGLNGLACQLTEPHP